MNLASLADKNIEKFGEYVSQIYEEKEYTNVDIIKLANRLSNALINLGVKRGDRIVVLLPNCPEVIISYLAIFKMAAMAIPVLFLLQPDEINFILKDSEANTLIAEPELLPKIDEARKGVKTLKNIIVVCGQDIPGALSYEKIIAASSDEFETADTDDDDTAVLIYTAGTTGQPKGVMLTHRNIYSNVLAVIDAGKIEKDDVALGVLPLAHAYGLTLMIIAFVIGLKNILMRWFETEKVFKIIEQYKVTVTAMVPTMFIYMLNFPQAEKYETSSMRYWFSGSAPLPVEVLKAFEEKFGGNIYEGYGLTETSPIVSANRPDRPVKHGSAGVSIQDIKVKIFDEKDQELSPGELGEIVVRGPNVMKGYYKKPEETREVMKSDWLHTGDMGYMDKDGYIYVTERKKDLIIRGGLNIYPRQVEEVIHAHPKVAEVAVVGVSHKTMGEEVKAFIVLKPGEAATEEEIISFAQNHLAKYKTPKYVEFRESLPKNIIGKIMRRQLREETRG